MIDSLKCVYIDTVLNGDNPISYFNVNGEFNEVSVNEVIEINIFELNNYLEENLDTYGFLLIIKDLKDEINSKRNKKIIEKIVKGAYEISLSKQSTFNKYKLMLELTTGVKQKRKAVTKTYDRHGVISSA